MEATIGYILNASFSYRNIPVQAAQIKNDIVLGYFYTMQFPIKSFINANIGLKKCSIF